MAGTKKRILKNKGGHELLAKPKSIAEEVAVYYGFSVRTPPEIRKDDAHKARAILEFEARNRKDGDGNLLGAVTEEKIALLRMYEEQLEDGPQPVLLFLEGNFPGSSSRGALRGTCFHLEIIGTEKSIAEAILIKTAFEILKEEGFQNLYVNLNSLGDRESVGRFVKELGAYYRKHANDLPAHCRQTMRRELFDLFSCHNEACQAIFENAPKSLTFLSELGRKHFAEVLEYLERLNIPYRIDSRLIGDRHFSSHTVFEICSLDNDKSENQSTPLATGLRYNTLSKKMGLKKEVPAVGITIAHKKPARALRPSNILAPKIFFIQLGFEAKLQSLEVIEMLRKAKVPLYQALPKDKLSAQLGNAESMKIPYTILMGQKEAMEGTVIVRDMRDRSQETVRVSDLPIYLKKIKIA